MIIRVRAVGRYRSTLIDKVAARSEWLLRSGFDWRQPFTDFEAVTFNEMVLKFWKPVRSFYNEKRFAIPEPTLEEKITEMLK